MAMMHMAKSFLIAIFVAHFNCCVADIYDGKFSLDFESIPPGHIAFRPLGKCTSGSTSYIGLINPAVLTHPDKFFLEISGGAVCFNKSSCEDSSLRRWTDIEVLLTEFMGVPKAMFDLLKQDIPVWLPLMGDLEPGWIPGQVREGTHPLDGMRGIFMPACTADIGVGRIDAKYEGNTFYHHGGMGIRSILTAVKKLIPDLSKMVLYGGSGGGVASAAWAPSVADAFPKANVYALVDSGFHLMPGTDIFTWFYKNVPWSHGPGESKAEKVWNVDVPKFDWSDLQSMATELNGYGGRVKVAYIGCDNDHIVYSDRRLIGKYIGEFNDTHHIGSQVSNMWDFLTMTHKCATEGSVSSWVASCTEHHLTRLLGAKWAKNESTLAKNPNVKVDNGITAQDFVYNFLSDRPLDPANPGRHAFWYTDRTSQMQETNCGGVGGVMTASGALASVAVAGWATVAVASILCLTSIY